ncbi:WXG100 family type VII secretion target [Enterococcus wangshanyuanii]|uniref:ESAT-6-like protein n=1 Tax=Enterococcus wangshanyuanii TaxID=2005703 RepID=A0ABQ1P889_9ENTE|nr:WXG100 family type VII secretion target [Enterococcus wangshanyuanii]GGC91055.1 hypothetical protein GCM10011573_20820 [Enterococcus wangshanyuanii]
MKIRLEYPELERLSSQLHSQEEVFTQCIAELKRLIYSAPDSWEGKSADVYIAQFNELQPSFHQTRQIIELLQGQIKETMAIMKDQDDTLAGKLNF